MRLSLDDAQVERLDQLLTDTQVHFTDYMMTLVNNTEVFTTYNPEIIYGLNNLIRTLSSLQYLGYDVHSDISTIYNTGVAHLNRYNPKQWAFHGEVTTNSRLLHLTLLQRVDMYWPTLHLAKMTSLSIGTTSCSKR